MNKDARVALGLRAVAAGCFAAFCVGQLVGLLTHPERLHLCSAEGWGCVVPGLAGIVLMPVLALALCWASARAFGLPCASFVGVAAGAIAGALVLVLCTSTGLDPRLLWTAPLLGAAFAGAVLVQGE